MIRLIVPWLWKIIQQIISKSVGRPTKRVEKFIIIEPKLVKVASKRRAGRASATPLSSAAFFVLPPPPSTRVSSSSSADSQIPKNFILSPQRNQRKAIHLSLLLSMIYGQDGFSLSPSSFWCAPLHQLGFSRVGRPCWWKRLLEWDGKRFLEKDKGCLRIWSHWTVLSLHAEWIAVTLMGCVGPCVGIDYPDTGCYNILIKNRGKRICNGRFETVQVYSILLSTSGFSPLGPYAIVRSKHVYKINTVLQILLTFRQR